MAVIFENQYQKIVKSTNNFVTQQTEIMLDVYKDKRTRDFEKQYKAELTDFCERIALYLQRNMNQLVEKTNKIKPIEEIDDPESFYKKYPDIKKEADRIQEIQDEGLFLQDKLSQETIDIDKLKYKDIWTSMGLTKELCQKIDYLGTRTVGFDEILNNNLSDLYDAVKSKYNGNIEDC